MLNALFLSDQCKRDIIHIGPGRSGHDQTVYRFKTVIGIIVSEDLFVIKPLIFQFLI